MATTTHLWGQIEQWLDQQMFRPTQAQMADRLGVTRSSVSQWKFGQARPTPQNLRDLARLTRIPYLALREAVMFDLGYTDEEEEEVTGDDRDAAPIAEDEPTGRAAARVERADPPPWAGASPPPRRESDYPGRDE